MRRVGIGWAPGPVYGYATSQFLDFVKRVPMTSHTDMLKRKMCTFRESMRMALDDFESSYAGISGMERRAM